MTIKKNFYDVIIIGSGPSGSSAAYYLSKNNFKVLILEKENLPRYKTCGGGLTFKGLSSLPFSIDDIIEKKCFVSEINDYESNLKFVVKRNNPMVVMVMRKEFDYRLINEAKNFGAEIKQGCELVKLIYHNDFVEIVTNKDKFYAKFLIAADGALSKTAKFGGWKNFKDLIPALEYEIFVDQKELDKFNDFARFDFGIIPGGYGWVFPKKEHLSIGILNMKQNKLNLNEAFQIYLDKIGIKNILNVERHGYVIPMNRSNKKFARNRIFLTGDAAGLVDPITGEGISFAILSGKIAAKSLIKNSLREDISEEFYNIEISKIILSELSAAKKLSYFIYEYPAVRKMIFKFYGERLSELISDVIMGEKKYTEILKNPFNYFKLFYKWNLKSSVKNNNINDPVGLNSIVS